MSEWKTVKLKDLLSYKGYIRGPFGSALRRGEMQQSGIPVYEQEHAINEIRHFRYFIDEKKYNELKRFTVVTDDIIISCSGTVGRISVIKKNDPIGIISQALLILRSNPDIVDVNYLKYFLRSKVGQNAILERSNGSVQVNICKREIIEEIPVPLPSLDTQKNIVQILSSLDDKIELNAQINHNLEEQAKAIYANYFTYSVNDSLPDNWRKGTLGEIIDLHDSKRIPLSGNERAKMEKIYPYYGAASLMDYVNDYLFDGVFLLLGEDGTVVTDNGLPVLQYVWGKFWVNNHAHILTGKAGFSVESLLLLLKQTPVKSIVTGAVQPKISQANLKSIQIVIPPEKLLQEFNSVITPLFALIRQNSEESKRLAQLRDALLPKLMSGEIDVSEIQV